MTRSEKSWAVLNTVLFLLFVASTTKPAGDWIRKWRAVALARENWTGRGYCQRAVKTSQGWADENQPL
jgi:hypothetical protein